MVKINLNKKKLVVARQVKKLVIVVSILRIIV